MTLAAKLPAAQAVNRRTACMAVMFSTLGSAAQAQTGRNVIIIVPQPAGNPSDVFARKMQAVMQRTLGQTLIVENLPGAGGSIGLQRMLNAPADGHVLAMVSQTEPILTPLALASVRYKPEQMRPVGMVGRTSYVLAGAPDLPAAQLGDLTGLAQKAEKYGKPLTYGHIGQGSMIHLLGAQWARLSGVALTHVPYRGVPPLLQDLMGGQIALSFVPLGGMAQKLIETGRLRVYGSTAAQAIPLLPNVAPLKTLAPTLKDFVYSAWGAMVVPRTTPDAALNRLHQAFSAAMRDAEVLAFLRENGTDPQSPISLAALEQFYLAEIQTHQTLARAVGIVAE